MGPVGVLMPKPTVEFNSRPPPAPSSWPCSVCRAKKRMQYNRRFVNVVTGVGGKRLGPNSNAAKV